MIDLKGGNPWGADGHGPGKAATYSRFILPFSYKLSRISYTQKNMYFKVSPFKDFNSATIHYFTNETAAVLFERALWARIPEKCWKEGDTLRAGPFNFITSNGSRKIPIKINRPSIVLFEGNHSSENDQGILHHGFLIIETYLAEQDDQVSMDDWLEFNEAFRYTNEPYAGYTDHYVTSMADFPADYRDGAKISSCKREDTSSLYLNRWLSLLELPLKKENGYFFSIVPEEFIEKEKKRDCETHLECNNERCLSYADNRTFIWTCAILENGAGKLARRFAEDVSKPWNFGHWLRLLNVDSPEESSYKTHSTMSDFQREWLKERTYQRWAEEGTYYGYSYHSGAMIGPSNDSLVLWYHFGQMYFDQILLLFYLRITLFAYSRALTHIHHKRNDKYLNKAFRKIRLSFAIFTNLYQFPLISNQQQGVEMYEIARKYMDIDQLFQDVKDEVTSTHEYLEMEKSTDLGEFATKISLIGVVIAFPSILDFLKKLQTCYWDDFPLISCFGKMNLGLSVCAIFGAGIIMPWSKIFKKIKRNSKY